MVENKTVKKLNYSSLQSGCDLSLQRLSYTLTEAQFFLKESEAQRSQNGFENKYFQNLD